jgi:hypothetical protein
MVYVRVTAACAALPNGDHVPDMRQKGGASFVGRFVARIP